MRHVAPRLPALPIAVAAILLAFALTAPAAQASGTAVWADCGDNGVVDSRHSQASFRSALENPPADAAEYTDCLNVIRQAQLRASQQGGAAGDSGAGGAAGGGGFSGGSAVEPEALSQALRSSGIDPAAPQGAAAPAPEPVVVDGQRIDLSASRAPSIAAALSLPLPLAAAAIVVLLSAGLPLVRFVVARIGDPQPGISTAP